MAIEPRELEQTGGRKSAARSDAREGRRERPAARVPPNEPGAEDRRPATATAAVEVSNRLRWVQRHGATVFITFVFVFLALLVVVKRLAM